MRQGLVTAPIKRKSKNPSKWALSVELGDTCLLKCWSSVLCLCLLCLRWPFGWCPQPALLPPAPAPRSLSTRSRWHRPPPLARRPLPTARRSPPTAPPTALLTARYPKTEFGRNENSFTEVQGCFCCKFHNLKTDLLDLQISDFQIRECLKPWNRKFGRKQKRCTNMNNYFLRPVPSGSGPDPNSQAWAHTGPRDIFWFWFVCQIFHISGQYHSAHQKSTGICMSRHGSVLRRPYRMQEFIFLTPGSKNQGQTIEITSEKKQRIMFSQRVSPVFLALPHIVDT